jgi:hypothetical protein
MAPLTSREREGSEHNSEKTVRRESQDGKSVIDDATGKKELAGDAVEPARNLDFLRYDKPKWYAISSSLQ